MMLRWTGLLVGLTMAAGALPGCTSSYNPGDEVQNRKETLGIVCEGKLKVAGSFQLEQAQPVDVYGCWPVGTWTFNVTVEDHDCDQLPVIDSQYSFQVSRDADENSVYTYLNEAAADRVRLKVGSGGGGLCEGSLNVLSPDGKILVNLKPALQADGSITGFGEIEVYDREQW